MAIKAWLANITAGAECRSRPCPGWFRRPPEDRRREVPVPPRRRHTPAMRILHVNTARHTGGAAQVAGALTAAQRTRGFDAEMLSGRPAAGPRSEEHTSALQSLMRNSYAVFCLKKNKNHTTTITP